MGGSTYPNNVRASIESAVAPSPSQDLHNKMKMDDLSNNLNQRTSNTDPLTNFKRYLAGDQQNNRENTGQKAGADEQYKAIESYKAQHANIESQKPLFDYH